MSADRTGTLVVGASQAGLQLATSLRQLGDDEPIVLAGSEAHAPYQRPPLSKGFLAGKADAASLAFRTTEWYDAQRIDLRLGTKIVHVDLDSPTAGSGIATTRSGDRIAFGRLAITVGGRARRLCIPGSDLAGVCVLRHLRNADELRTRLGTAARVVVIGGGFIGLEAAASATAAGKDVTVVDVADRLLGRAVAPTVSEFYLAAHQRRGTRIRLRTGVDAFVGSNGAVSGVRLSDGSVLPADIVLVGIGLEPRTELAEALGLEVENGIVVDEYARTSHPHIVAAGDCTVLPHPLTREGRVRIESVQNAVSQGRIAAASLLGVRLDARQVPWFWSDQADLKLQIAGLSNGYDDHVLRGDPATERFSVLYYRSGQLIAADSVNSPRDYMVVRKVLGDGGNISTDRAADAERPLKELITAGSRAVLA
jgi:3-phenylpropionate/trans-cinnamate dioxygenase ferredoxin reductase subunit